jgi:hypothetical protein
MNDAVVSRANPWMIVAVVAALLIVVAAALLAPMALHAMSGTLQGPRHMAGWGCGGSVGTPC